MLSLIDKVIVYLTRGVIRWLDAADDVYSMSENRFVSWFAGVVLGFLLIMWFFPLYWLDVRELDLDHPRGHSFGNDEDRYSEPIEAEIEINWLQEGF